MSLSPDKIKKALAGADHPLGIQELLRVCGLNPGHQTDLKRALRDLVRSGEVEKTGKRFQLPGAHPVPKANAASAAIKGKSGRGGSRTEGHASKGPRGGPARIEGTLHMHRDGFGFVHPLSGEGENIFIPADQAKRAFDNDRVVVEVVPGQGGRSAGRLVKVTDRKRTQVVGTYVDRPKGAYVEPHDKSLKGPIRVPRTQMARDGDVVKVRLDVGAGLIAPGEGLFGEVSGSLGKPGDSSVEVLSIAYAQGFSDEFPPEVMDEADSIPLGVSAEDAKAEGRRDLRSLALVTIDGEDARDFDDAIYVEGRGDAFRLVVAIADVTHYVREGTALDAEALNRATSVYLPDRVLPMLPERLSNGICSLKPDEDRLCMVADMVIDPQGEPQSAQIYPGVMRSVARCTYNEVHRVLAGEDVPRRSVLKPHFQRMAALANKLHEMRLRRGAIDFDLPETKIELDEEGKPKQMVKRERLESHRLVEECMLAANEAVARYCQEQKLPSVYRFHGEPDPDKLSAFAALAKVYGFALPPSKGGEISSKDLNALLEKLQGHREQRALNQLLLRSMMQAVYSSEQVGHFGLAAENYLHFTSPIRRYPDLLVHRLLKAHWERKSKKRSTHDTEAETERLEGLAVQSSDRERAAMQVEREVVSFYSTLLMKDRVGEEFGATISSLTDFGFFVELDDLFIEGLVKGESVEQTFEFDKAIYSIVFGSGRKVRVGEKLQVKLISANLQRRQLDFEVIAFAGEEPLAPRAATPARAQGGWRDRISSRPTDRQRPVPSAPAVSLPSRREQPLSRREQPPGRQEQAPSRREQPPLRQEQAPSRREQPARREPSLTATWAEPEEVASGSPHPGFDRLRALASRGPKIGSGSSSGPRKSGGEQSSSKDSRPKKSNGRDSRTHRPGQGGRGKGRRR